MATRSPGRSPADRARSRAASSSDADGALGVADLDMLKVPCAAGGVELARPVGRAARVVGAAQTHAADVEAARRRRGDRRADLARRGLDRELIRVRPAAATQVEHRLAGAIARELGLGAIGVEDPQPGDEPGLIGRREQQDPVGEHTGVPGAQRRGSGRASARTASCVGLEDHDSRCPGPATSRSPRGGECMCTVARRHAPSAHTVARRSSPLLAARAGARSLSLRGARPAARRALPVAVHEGRRSHADLRRGLLRQRGPRDRRHPAARPVRTTPVPRSAPTPTPSIPSWPSW